MRTLKKEKLVVFIILSATVALAYQLPYMKYTFYDQMMEALQLNDTQMGFLTTCLTFANTLCYPIGGFFADRFPMKKLICITLAAFAVLTALFGFTTNYYILIGIHISYGFFGYRPFVDSAVLKLSISQYGADTLTPQQFGIYEIVSNDYLKEGEAESTKGLYPKNPGRNFSIL